MKIPLIQFATNGNLLSPHYVFQEFREINVFKHELPLGLVLIHVYQFVVVVGDLRVSQF